MIQNVLHQKLRPLIEAEKTLRRRRGLSLILGLGTIAAGVLFWMAHTQTWWSWPSVLYIAAGVIIASWIVVWWAQARTINVKELAEKIETNHPDLQAALVTAVEQQPGESGELGYLQERVIYDAVDHAVKHNWVRRVSRSRLIGAGFTQVLAMLAFAVVMLALLGQVQRSSQLAALAAAEEEAKADPDAPLPPYEISVNPGDAEVERGSRLIVEAKFGEKRIPPDAVIVVSDPGEEGAERGRIPMKAGLDETAFAGMIAKIDKNAVYRIDFDGEASDEFSITTYIHPELEQADATVTPPEYAKQEPKEIENTRKVSLLEGSELEWKLKVNKPVAAAELFGEDESIVALEPSAEDPTVLVASHAPDETQKYRLHLIDDKDRPNKKPPWFTVTVKRNLPPQLDFTFPKRDVQVSAIEELPIEAKVWDDLGVMKAGATLTFGDETTDIELASEELEGGKHHPLSTLFLMEELGAKPRDLVAYHLWAEDIGPDGKPRRSSSDMFFAEVRHFEDIFREQENMGGGGQPPPGGGAGGQAEELLKLQKEVMNATWKLIRQSDMGKTFEQIGNDIAVVKESQEIAIQQTQAAIEEAEDPEVKALFEEAGQHMMQAVLQLEKSFDFEDTKQLRPAHDIERKAYETLIRARSREHNVMLAQQQQQGQGQGQQNQQQMMELEMKQKELRYEENSQAESQNPAEAAEQQENLGVLNRLKELARRQEAIAKKIKELETALDEAETEEEKQELERQLKRLQEEQEQLLRELDEVSERMDTEENRANMAEEREQLEETRESVKEASEKLEEGELADAANAATRAQEKLEDVKEDFRKKTSRQFSDEMRDIRRKARELAENQETIGERFEENPTAQQKADPFSQMEASMDNSELARELETQKKAASELLDRMQEISEQSEAGEPLLSDALYEGYRKAKMGGIEESLDEARDLTRYNRREIAQESERAAARGIDELKEDVEKAAEKVLGSEADALRLARSELENLIDQASEEAERIGGQQDEAGENQEGEMELAMNEQGQGRRAEDGEGDPQEGQQPGEGEGQGQEPQENQEGQRGQGQQPGEGEGKGQEPQENQKGQRGQGQQPGEGEGQDQEPQENQEGQRGQGQQPGEGEGQGQEPGEQPGEGQQPGQGQQPGEGEGQQPGEGEGESESERPSPQGKGKGKGMGKGKGETPSEQEGQQPGESEGEGEGEGQSEQAQGKGKGKGQGKGQGQGDGQGERGYRQGFAEGDPQEQDPSRGQQTPPSASPSGSRAGGGASNSANGGPNQGGGEGRRRSILPRGIAEAGRPLFFEEADEFAPEGPITGDDFEEWSDRLRNIEDMLEQDDLRNEVAKVLDDARSMRIDFRKDNLPPQADSIRQRITNPLVELRDRVAEELAKLDKDNPLAPIDRDPVPREFRELVRRYYEELGSGR